MEMFGLVKSSFQLLTVSLGSITEGVSLDAVGAVVWIVVFGGCSDQLSAQRILFAGRMMMCMH